jgi:hypothetical protein
MAYDERLADRVRRLLASRKGISERKMFGGIAFLIDGKICVGVINDELIVRVGRDGHADAMGRKHTRPMDFTGRPMRGMVYVEPAGVARGVALERWIETGVNGARTSPASKKRVRKSVKP